MNVQLQLSENTSLLLLWNVLFFVTIASEMITINEESSCEDVVATGECECSRGLVSLYVRCNISGSIYQGRFIGNQSASIECSGKPVTNRTLFIGKRNQVQLRNCLYHMDPTSLRRTLDTFGTSDETRVEIVFDNDTAFNLSENYFQGFHELKTLRLNFKMEILPPNVFNELTMLEHLTLRGSLNELPSDLLIEQYNLTQLNLKYNQIVDIPANFFRHQNMLVHLDISVNLLTSITETTFSNLSSLVYLDLSNNLIQSMHAQAFRNTTKLKFLMLKVNKLASIPPALLRGLTRLSNLDLSANQLRLLPPDLLRNHTQLFRSDLSKNGIETLPEALFETNGALQYVNISHNSLVTLPSKLFHTLQRLISLDLSNNQLSSLDPDIFDQSPYVNFLYLQNNHLWFAGSLYRNEHDLEESSYSPFWPIRTQLRELNLRNNNIDRMDIAWIESPELKRLDLSYNKLVKFDNEDFKFMSEEMVVNLEFNQIAMLSLVAADATRGSGGFILFKLNHNPLNCDCRIASFVRFLQMTGHVYRRWRFTVDHLRCIDPEINREINVVKVNIGNLLCEMNDHCPDRCGCFVRSNNESVLVNCEGQNLTDLPNLTDVSRNFNHVELFVTNNNIKSFDVVDPQGYEKVKEFYASYNQIQNLTGSLLSNVEILDLSNNSLSSFSQLTLLFNSSRQLESAKLSSNPWQCDCQLINHLRIIQNSSDRIVDSKHMRCSDGRDFNLLTVSDLCPMGGIATIIIFVCSVVILLLLLSFTAYAYQIEIKIWLFTNNLCLRLVTEEEIDKDKLYDAFVSYCHQDEEFVSAILVPRLETAPMNLKVCWHMRDWNPGEVITTQIVQSIENSRRTIVVLSRDFLESSWGQLEFRTAHVNSMAEKRIRVIIVIYGDLGDEERIDSEMKAYLKTNTYIKWGDPWFWQKLRYSMPHPARVKGVRWNRASNRVDVMGTSDVS
nr:protein toll-like [Aedes albopictus]